MNSCLYECVVMHCRTKPKVHRLIHKVFMFYLDLDEIDRVVKDNSLISRNRWNVYSFYDKDHLPFGKATVRENLIEFLKRKGIDQSVGRVMLLTNLRTFGYVFNPVSFYFCFDEQGEPLCAIPEIGNTFGEIKPFILNRSDLKKERFSKSEEKFYYISPFSELDISLEFNLKIPGERLDIRVDDLQGAEKILYASLVGQRRPLTFGNLLWFTFKFPLVTLKVIGLIHFHALLLYFKKVPFHRKESNPHLQKEVLRVRDKDRSISQ